MRFLWIVTTIGMLITNALCGEKPEKPFMLDGPGMEYIDSEYRTDYANCLPFDEISANPYVAICYLGRGDVGRLNRDRQINRIFYPLEEEKIKSICDFLYEGEEWYLVIPRYKEQVYLKKEGTDRELVSKLGEAFVVRCHSDVTLNMFSTRMIEYAFGVEENGKLKNISEDVWDITNTEEILPIQMKGD